MKRLLFFVSFLSLNIVVFAQKEKANNYIKLYKDAAIREMKRGGVPAAIILAQGMLESSYGESELCKKSNNHFGIKCKDDWAGEKAYHDDDEKGECFRVYTSVDESYADHTNFLKSRNWYAFLFNLPPTDYESWAKGLKKAGYATEKNYAQKLIKVIEDNELQQYTLQGLQKENTDESNASTDVVADTVVNNSDEENFDEEVKEDTVVKDTSEIETKPVQDTTQKTTISTNDSIVVKTPNYTPDSIFTINHAKVIYVLEGTSFLSVANKYKISLSTLFSYNDMKPLDLVDKDRLIFIERKLKKGAVELYTSQGNETLYDVSQTQGVQLENLLQYNKNLKQDSKLSKGDKVYLRPVNKNTK
ncbi:MAG: glucosaminidase domain-containing protein [Chitinophagales bacterium]|nr:glucosaminidase domain-containing protein [Chitinophagales bacterium]